MEPGVDYVEAEYEVIKKSNFGFGPISNKLSKILGFAFLASIPVISYFVAPSGEGKSNFGNINPSSEQVQVLDETYNFNKELELGLRFSRATEEVKPYSESLDSITASWRMTYSTETQKRITTIKENTGVRNFNEGLDYVLVLNNKLPMSEFYRRIALDIPVSDEENPNILLEGQKMYFSAEEMFADKVAKKYVTEPQVATNNFNHDYLENLLENPSLETIPGSSELEATVVSQNIPDSLENKILYDIPQIEQFDKYKMTTEESKFILETYIASEMSLDKASEEFTKKFNKTMSSSTFSRIARSEGGYFNRTDARIQGLESIDFA